MDVRASNPNAVQSTPGASQSKVAQEIPKWLKYFLFASGIVGVGVLAGSVINALTSTPKRSSARLPSRSRMLPARVGAGERLANNREQGADFEDAVGEGLAQAFPGKKISSQVTVLTPEGKKRRLDYALEHSNGSVTSVEVKNVAELQEKHVQQAEEQRAALKHTFGVRTGLPIVVVPEHTVVREEHESRVRVFRAGANTGKRRRQRA